MKINISGVLDGMRINAILTSNFVSIRQILTKFIMSLILVNFEGVMLYYMLIMNLSFGAPHKNQ